MSSQIDLIRGTLQNFCLEFIKFPYLCYTEHGQHALFFSMLYSAMPEQKRYIEWCGQKVCILQKEFPTCGNLGRPQRQHWDIAVIKNPPESKIQTTPLSYDYLRLAAVIEFGMNEAEEHLLDDIERLCHPDANVESAFLVHLYRISQGGAKYSHRDWSPNSARIVSLEKAASLTINCPVEVYYGLYDSTYRYHTAAFRIRNGDIQQIKKD